MIELGIPSPFDGDRWQFPFQLRFQLDTAAQNHNPRQRVLQI